MSVSGGSFGVARAVRGGAQSARPSRYYIGFWPCQQAEGDADEGRVTDRSGNGAHATLQSLTKAEAWANAGFLSSTAVQGHSAIIPLAKWTPRFATHSFFVFGYQRLVKGASSIRVFGNGIGTGANGFNVVVTTSGTLQVNMAHQTDASMFSLATSTFSPYATDSLHSWMVAYNLSDRSWTIFGDGAATSVRNDKNISAQNVLLCDTVVATGPAIGGRPAANGAAIAAVRTRMLHALAFEGMDLPSNISTIAQRLHAHPRLLLRDHDLVF